MKTKNEAEIVDTDKVPYKKGTLLAAFNRLSAYKNIPKFLKLVWQTSPGLTLVSIVLRLVQAASPLIILGIGKAIIDQVVLITRNKDLSRHDLWRLIIIEFIMVLLTTIFNRASMLLDDLLGELLTNRTNVMLMSHAARLDLAQFEDSVFYDKLERARQQTIGRTALLSQVLNQTQDTITMVSYLTILLAFNAWIILTLIVAMLPVLIGYSYFNAKNYSLVRSQTHGKRMLEYFSLLGSSDLTAKEIRLFDLSSFFIERYKTISVSFYRAKRKLGIRQSLASTLLAIPGAVWFYMSFMYVINQVVTGVLSIGGLTFFLGAIRGLASLVGNSGKRMKAVAEGAIYLQDFFDFFTIEPTIKITSNPRPFPNPIIKGFTFENVGFKYNNSNRWANRHLNFTIKPGEKMALVGENGAGKSTIVKLLTRLYEPTEGRITLDGYDLKEYNVKELQMHMGVIFQDFIRYQLSASENIAMGNISELDNQEQIEASARKSYANTIIEKLPQTYQQTLGHHFAGGFELSGGEWQKVALARAYMRNAPIIILDEPTAALDARSEYDMFQRFAEVTNNKTALFISHRFSTVRMADRIMVLEKGEIIEMGSHDELLLKEGRYAELFELQALGYK